MHRGEKVICLAITEPYAGSDVAGLRCEAKLSEDGKYYIVNGEKKWITNGVFADFFTTAVRTGEVLTCHLLTYFCQILTLFDICRDSSIRMFASYYYDHLSILTQICHRYVKLHPK